MSARVLAPLHQCGIGCTGSFTPLTECACACLGGHHGRDTGIAVERRPARTVYLRNERNGDTRHGYAAVRETFGVWFVHEVLDVGAVRRYLPVAEIGTQEAAEAHALALALPVGSAPAAGEDVDGAAWRRALPHCGEQTAQTCVAWCGECRCCTPAGCVDVSTGSEVAA